MSNCKNCGKEIIWVKTTYGKSMPVDVDTLKDKNVEIFDHINMISHFTTCPDANKFRGK